MPHLKAGETAPGIAKKAQKNAASVAARMRALAVLEARPSGTVKEEETAVFLDLRAFAGWSDSARGIAPMSPNTLRKYLYRTSDGGYSDVRSRALALTPPTTKGERAPSKSAAQLVVTADATLMMTARYLDLLDRMERLQKLHDDVDAAVRAHFRLYECPKPHLKVVK